MSTNQPAFKQPVFSEQAEHSTLGAAMVDSRLWPDITAIVKVEDFYQEASRHVFRAMSSAYSKHKKLDVLLIADELSAAGVFDAAGGQSFLLKLAAAVPSVVNFEAYAEIVADGGRQRRLAAMLEGAAAKCYDPSQNAIELAQDVQKGAADIISTKTKTSFRSMVEIDIEWDRKYREREAGFRTPYHRCGVSAIDDVVDGGFHFGRSYWTAGLSKMGKTKFKIALILGILKTNREDLAAEYEKLVADARRTGEESSLPTRERYIAQNAIVVEWYTAENTETDLYQRLLSCWMNFPETGLKRPRQNDLTDDPRYQERLVRARMELVQLGIRIRFQARPKLRDIILNTKQRIAEVGHNRVIVVVDYIQRVDAGHDGQNAEYRNTTEASMMLSGLAIELGIMGMYVSHFNRSGAQRTIPKPSDLRGTGQIEQDVDHLLILHRPFWDDPHDSSRGKFAILWHALSRHSETGRAYLEAHMDRNRFVEWTHAMPALAADD